MTEISLDRAFGVLVRRMLWRRCLEAAAIAASVGAISALAGTALVYTAATATGAWLFAFIGTGLLPRYRRVTLAAFAEHLDRRFPALEESTRLLLADEEQLASLQQLQRARVLDALPAALAKRQRWLPPATHTATLAVLVAAGVLALFATPLRGVFESTTSAGRTPRETTIEGLFTSTGVRIEPPAYTGIDATTTDHLDLELPEGSIVRWDLALRRNGDFALVIGDEMRVPLVASADKLYTAEAQIDQTSLYRIVETIADGEEALAGIHTLSVVLDRPPRVRIVDPAASALEIRRGETPRFDSEVVVRDDFGVGPVEIRASVAKGSGEGVKFRDEVFAFDSEAKYAMDGDAGRRYQRAWDLRALGMEPGDEVYFFVVASDNRDPEPNVSRSDTVVVRWLAEAPETVTVGDIAIDFMPEYYKSQRQIIIETEQLIADRELLDADTFNATSRALGDAQAELKNRYGQFLGDEFGESPDGEVGLPELEAEFETHDEHEHEHHDERGHGDAEDTPATFGDDAALVAQFTHRHEAADVGPVSARNPVGLMKRAVAKMWESELHLRLSEPAKALPHQYEALAYYNRAREADRIFTRRLGFEPPPVSEERRLSGDIDEVQGARLVETGADTGADKHLFRDLYTRLSTRSPTRPFDATELELLARAADRLQALATERPALIRQAATLERLRLAGAPAAANCEDCVADGMRAAWSALLSARARPTPGTRAVAPDDALVRDYAGLKPRVD